MRLPVITPRREARQKRMEDVAIEKAVKALAKTFGESGALEKASMAGMGGFGSNAAAMLSARSSGRMPGTSWSNQTNAMSNALIARATANLASSFDRAPAELELAMAEQGLSWGPPFPPGRPLDPFFGVRRPPRTWDFTVGENVQLTPRWNRISFQTIKGIYEAYDVAQICVRHLINDVRSLDYAWEPIPGVKEDVSGDIEQAIEFFDSPDKRQPFRAWLAEWLQDILRYDAGALYIRRDMKGDPLALEVVSGETIIPLIDFFGRRPQDEDDTEDIDGLFEGEIVPAFLQIVEGLPWDWLAADDLIYQPLNPMPESQYGLAPLEAVLLSATTDIRLQWHFLQFFTEGTLPAGFMEAPPEMSDPTQVEEWQQTWDAIMLGDQSKLRQIRWVPAGSNFTPAKEQADKFASEFPLYLMRRTCASFGVTPADLGFTETVNRATGDTQIDVQFRVGTAPILRHVEDIINLFTKQYLKLRCRIKFDDGRETEDRLASAQASKIYIEAGVLSPDEPRQELGYAVDKSRPTPRSINNARSGPIPLLALESMAGEIDPETFAPAAGQAMIETPFASPTGVLPPQGSMDAKTAAETTAQQAHDLVEATTGKKSPIADAEEQQKQEAAQLQQKLLTAGKPEGGKEELEGEEENEDAPAKKSWAEITLLLDRAEKGDPSAAAELWALRTGGTMEMGRFVKAPDNTGGPGLGKPSAPSGSQAKGSAASGSATTMVGGGDGGITASTGIQGSGLEDDEDDEVEKDAALVALALRRWRDSSRNRLKKGRRPRRFVDPMLPDSVHDEVWAMLEKARSREEVDAAFLKVAEKKASAARGRPSTTARTRSLSTTSR